MYVQWWLFGYFFSQLSCLSVLSLPLWKTAGNTEIMYEISVEPKQVTIQQALGKQLYLFSYLTQLLKARICSYIAHGNKGKAIKNGSSCEKKWINMEFKAFTSHALN